MFKKLIIVFLFLCSCRSYAATWEYKPYTEETIDNNFDNKSLSVIYNKNLKNFPYIAFAYGGTAGLYYAVFDTSISTWNKKAVKNSKSINGEIGSDISLAIDVSGSPHISYSDPDKRILKYAYYNTDWIVETLDSSIDVGRYSCIQLENNQYPHIAYYDDINGALKYIYSNGAGWKRETIDIADKKMAGLYISFKIDKENKRHICYYDATDDNLKYAYYNGETWKIETVDSAGITGLYANLSLDKYNKPCICYYGNGNLKYAYKNDENNWSVETVDPIFSSGMYKTSMFIDEANNKYIFYFVQELDPRQIRYAKLTADGRWEINIIKQLNIYPQFPGDIDFDIVTDINNEFWFIYSYAGIRFMGPKINEWSYQKIQDGYIDKYSFSLDSQGNPHIVYSFNNQDTTRIKYSYYETNIWKNKEIKKSAVKNTTFKNISFYPVLQADGQDKLYLAYSENSSDSNKIGFLQKNSDGWNDQVLEENTDRFGRIKFILDKNNIPYIGYYNYDKNLKISYLPTSQIWGSSIFDISKKFDDYSLFSFDFDNQNTLNLSYTYRININDSPDLYYCYLKDNIWGTPVEIDKEISSYLLNIKTGNDDKKNLIYKKFSKDEVRYAINEENNWIIEQTEDIVNGGISNLQINNNELTFIGFSDQLYKYFRKNNKWEKSNISQISSVTQMNSASNIIEYKSYNNQLAFIMNANTLGLIYYTQIKLKLDIVNQNDKVVTFNVSRNGPKGIKIDKYLWNFEGTEGIQLVTTESTANYTYSNTGNYKARVIAIMENGIRNVTFADVEIR